MAAACTGGSSDPTTTTTSASTTTTAATTTTIVRSLRPAATMPVFPDDDELIPVDEDVVIGSLDNGLTYYIRENDAPGGRAQLRLVVNAGSLLEDDDQRGGAHYLEHMMFNGTEAYPENELVRVLQRFGSEFGPDINAYTNYDETVYELQVPTDSRATLDTAVDVLFEWASRATIDPAEVELERGVLVEEWRLRSQGFWGRYFDRVDDILLAGTVYDGQDPLGTLDDLRTVEAASLRGFYDDWYRPSLMAVVAVGDFDIDRMESTIRDRFGSLSDPVEAPTRIVPISEPFAEAATLVLIDDELPNAFVELNYPMPVGSPATVGAIRRDTAFGLALTVIITRLQEDALRGDVPFFDPSFAANPLVRAQQSPGLAASAEPTKLHAATEALLSEVERAVRFGFTQKEVDRAVTDYRQAAELGLASADSTQDWEFAGRYVEHFLGDLPIPDAQTAHDLDIRILDEITPDQVADTFRAMIMSTEPLIIVAGPTSARASIPTDDELLSIYDRVLTTEVDQRQDTGDVADGLMVPPAPVAIVDRSELFPLDITVLELQNGVTVAYRQTDISAGFVSFGAVSPGGWSIVPESDVTEVQYASSIITRSGVADLDQVQLERVLSGTTAGAAPYVDITSEGWFGGAATDDLETLFQLVHLYMTRPRLDPASLSIFDNEVRPLVENPDLVPNVAVLGELIDQRYGGDERFAILPSVEDLDSFDLEAALDGFRARFADADDFVFGVAGDFEIDDLEDLAARYLGTLPTLDGDETWVDVQPDPPAGVVRSTVEAGTGQLGGVTFLFVEEVPTDPVTTLEAAVLGQVLNQRLTERIREQLSATYSPFAAVDVLGEPDEVIEVYIDVSADPAGLDAVSAAVLADLDDLRTAGPTADQLAIAQEQLIREFELVSNEFWVDTMLFYLANTDEDPNDVNRRISRVAAITRDDVRNLARLVLPVDNYIEVRLVPVS